MDESPDEEFYEEPRLVTHIDDRAIEAVTQLYREILPPGGAVLDLMSSWISHLPPEIGFRRVVGLGMNEQELRANPRLHAYNVHNLNQEPALPYTDGEFDAACICVSVDYLVKPVEVIRDIGRVLTPGAPLVITFSNRCFPTKAVAIWHRLTGAGQQQLVEAYLTQADNWEDVRSRTPIPEGGAGDPLYAVLGNRGHGPHR
jgi:SAM-dependent methyltransferase